MIPDAFKYIFRNIPTLRRWAGIPGRLCWVLFVAHKVPTLALPEMTWELNLLELQHRVARLELEIAVLRKEKRP
jgi:hypothetical protein